ncbi:GNAT family N-acetyltransferase [Pseudomonas cremoricolorata]|uniref:Acyltransferase superfamily protein n=1 Tax=Pseudomonas cremoricolorata TaxID=157783 RepID=A0A089WER8_9PSED|nr:GNAT family N-acetyltransferase [Pseudomonas cremoricolorata]AIR87770.1 acyltransferase superfamily protein [Pseudomonas cremoricolorata]
MISLHSLAHLHDLPAATWDALVPPDQPFLRHAFLSAMEDSASVCRATGWAAEHLVLERDGDVRALLPAYRKWHSFGEYVFDHGWAEACERAGIAYYPKLLGAVPFSPVSGPRLLAHDQADAQLLVQALPEYLNKGQLSGAHINFTDPGLDQLLATQPGWLQRLGCQFHWRNRDYRDFQDFLDTLTSRKRKQLRKEREQVAGQGIVFTHHQGGELSEAQWDFIYRCYANTYAVRRRAPYLTRAFFSLIAERMPEAIHVVIARQGSREVAMALSLLGSDSLYGRYWGCLDEFDRLHFETCFYQGMEFAIGQDLRRFDAGAQGEHKLIRGFEPVLTHSWHYLLHPGLRQAVDEFLCEERVGVQAYAEQAKTLLPYRCE